MRPNDICISDTVQYTSDRPDHSALDSFEIMAAIVTRVHDDERTFAVALHVFPAAGGWMDVNKAEWSSHPAGTAEAVGKWSFPL
jgi:hypothetical protein